MKRIAKNYLASIDKFLQQGKKELELNNLRQASEKFWGAAALAVKAYAEMKNLSHDGHGKLFTIVSRLSEKMKFPEIEKQFTIASALHTNFYEGWMTKSQIEKSASEVEDFCNKIKSFLNKK